MNQTTTGAVAMIDALGVKARGRDIRLLESMREANRAAHGISRYIRDAHIPRLFSDRFGATPRVLVAGLSDSIIIAVVNETAQAVDNALLGALLDVACLGVSYVLRTAAECDPPLVYRGAVTTGQVLVDFGSDEHQHPDDGPSVFFFGDAVFEAATWHEQADAALVWLLPRTEPLSAPAGMPHKQLVFDAEVPLSGGRTIRAGVVTPFVDLAPCARQPVRDGFERALQSDRPDIVIKRQNTLRALDILQSMP